METRHDLGIALAPSGRLDEAAQQVETALRIQDSPQIRDSLNQIRQAERAREGTCVRIDDR